MRSVAFTLLAVAASCGPSPGPLTIRFALSDGPTQTCPATSCTGVASICAPIVHVRIVDPGDPSTAYVSMCQALPATGDVCGIGELVLPIGSEIPSKRVEVQVAVWAKDDVTTVNGELRCPTSVTYSATDQFAVATNPMPALAGRTFVEPDDATATVTLGCGNLGRLARPQCDERPIALIARVIDVESAIYVSAQVAAQLLVSAGKPSEQGDSWELGDAAQIDLARANDIAIPTWSGLHVGAPNPVCVAVRDDLAQSTTLATCTTTPTFSDLTAYWLSSSLLRNILRAMGTAEFPTTGLVVGVVVDSLGQAASGVRVTANNSANFAFPDGTLTALGNTATSTAGLFVSSDAPANTMWTLEPPFGDPLVVSGGLISGKVTIVFARLPALATNVAE